MKDESPRALISVFDKDGISDFAKKLKDFGWEILSTGGTARLLRENGVDVTDDLAVDFTVTTNQGSVRLIRLAFEYADKNNIDKLRRIPDK